MNFSGERLRKIRLSKGISQVQMANDCGLNQSLVSKYERGDVLNPPHYAVKLMADYLNVHPDEFYGDPSECVFCNEEIKSANETQRLDIHVYFHFNGEIK